MSAIYPLNSHPWNTFPLNEGFPSELNISFSVTSDLSPALSRETALNLAFSTDSDFTNTLGITAPIGCTFSCAGTFAPTQTMFYRGARPSTVISWDDAIAPSSNKIIVDDWANL